MGVAIHQHNAEKTQVNAKTRFITRILILKPLGIGTGLVECICPVGYTGTGVGPTGCTFIGQQPQDACGPFHCVHGYCTRNGPISVCTCLPGYQGEFFYCKMYKKCLNIFTFIRTQLRYTPRCLCFKSLSKRWHLSPNCLWHLQMHLL